MKEWWHNLSLHEKKMLIAGGIVVLVLCLYEFVWAAVVDSSEELRHKISRNHTLLAFMQETDKQIQLVDQQATTPSGTTSSLLSTVQNDIANTPLKSALAQLQQSDNDSVQLHFQQVNFDELIRWLATLCHTHSLTITQMSITPSANNGIVDMTLRINHS
jgi:type II secretory pathway component PulM